jgi:HEAT repeat protein
LPDSAGRTRPLDRILAAAPFLAAGFLPSRPQGDLADLRSRLKSPEVPVRRQAAEDLAKFDTPAGARLLLEAIEDPAPKVRDEAVRSLGRLGKTEALAVVAKEGLASKHAGVRLGCAEALGRARGTFDRASLLRMAQAEKDPLARLAAIRSLGRVGAAAEFDPLSRLEGKDPEVRAEVLRALAAIDGARAKPILREALGGPDDVAAAALRTFSEADSDEGLEHAIRLLASTGWRARSQAIRTLERSRDAQSIEALLGRLAVEERPRLREDIARALRSLTGMKFRTEAVEWERWWKENGAGFRVPPRAGEAPPREATSASFCGLPLASDALVFVLDYSGSMREPAEAGSKETRKDRAVAELARALRALPPSARFNVLLVRAEVEPYSRRGLQPAAPKSVEEAVSFAGRADARQSGDFWKGFRAAMEDPDADSVCFLSDGAPSAGTFVYRERLVEAVDALARLRQVEVNTALFGGSDFDRRFLEELARATGGDFRAAR